MAENNNYTITDYGSLIKATHQGTPFEIYRFNYSADEFDRQVKDTKNTVIIYLIEGRRTNGEPVIFSGQIKNCKDVSNFTPDQTIDWRRFYLIKDTTGQHLTINTVDYILTLFYLQANYGTEKYNPDAIAECKSTMSDKAIQSADYMYKDVYITLDVIGLHLNDIIHLAKIKRKKRSSSTIPSSNSSGVIPTSHYQISQYDFTPSSPISTPFYPSQMMPNTNTSHAYSNQNKQSIQTINIQNNINAQQSQNATSWLPSLLNDLDDELYINNLYTYFKDITESNSLIHHLVRSVYIPVKQHYPNLRWEVLDNYIFVKHPDIHPDILQDFIFSMNIDTIDTPTIGLKITINIPPTRINDPFGVCYSFSDDIYQTYTKLTTTNPADINAILQLIQQAI